MTKIGNHVEAALVCERPSTPLQRLVLLVLALYADRNGYAPLTRQDITRLTKCSSRAAQGALNALQYKSLVRSQSDGYQLMLK